MKYHESQVVSEFQVNEAKSSYQIPSVCDSSTIVDQDAKGGETHVSRLHSSEIPYIDI